MQNNITLVGTSFVPKIYTRENLLVYMSEHTHVFDGMVESKDVNK